MTYNEARNTIITYLTRVGTNRISGQEVREAVLIVLDFAAAIQNNMPPWNAELVFQTDGSDAGRFCVHPDTNGNKRFFETKVDDNQGNEPPTDPNTRENSFWEEVSASAGSGIVEWTPGVYGAGLIIVFHSHSIDGRGLYVLIDPERPFNSSDIEAEITAGKWERMNSENLQATLILGNSAGNMRIRDLADPIDPQDADTKSARESAVSALETSLRANVPSAGDNLEKLYNLIFGIGAFAGNHAATGGALPANGTGLSGAINKGDYWIITAGGTIAGIDGADDLQPNDVIYAKQAGANLPAHFFGVNSNVDLATDSVMGLVKLVQAIGAGAADSVLSTSALKVLLDAKRNLAAEPAVDITGAIVANAVTIACNGRRETEVYCLRDSNLNISWTGLDEGGIIYLRIERTTTNSINVNFNGSNNQDCFMDASNQQIGSGSPLVLSGHSGTAGINRKHYRLSIESVKDITAGKMIYLVRVSDTGSIIV